MTTRHPSFWQEIEDRDYAIWRQALVQIAAETVAEAKELTPPAPVNCRCVMPMMTHDSFEVTGQCFYKQEIRRQLCSVFGVPKEMLGPTYPSNVSAVQAHADVLNDLGCKVTKTAAAVSTEEIIDFLRQPARVTCSTAHLPSVEEPEVPLKLLSEQRSRMRREILSRVRVWPVCPVSKEDMRLDLLQKTSTTVEMKFRCIHCDNRE